MRFNHLNKKGYDVNNRLTLICQEGGIPFISHCRKVKWLKHLYESK